MICLTFWATGSIGWASLILDTSQADQGSWDRVLMAEGYVNFMRDVPPREFWGIYSPSEDHRRRSAFDLTHPMSTFELHSILEEYPGLYEFASLIQTVLPSDFNSGSFFFFIWTKHDVNRKKRAFLDWKPWMWWCFSQCHLHDCTLTASADFLILSHIIPAHTIWHFSWFSYSKYQQSHQCVLFF